MKLSVKMLATIAVAVSLGSAEEKMQFPQQKSYPGCIKPKFEQTALNKVVKDYYFRYGRISDLWKGDKSPVLKYG